MTNIARTFCFQERTHHVCVSRHGLLIYSSMGQHSSSPRFRSAVLPLSSQRGARLNDTVCSTHSLFALFIVLAGFAGRRHRISSGSEVSRRTVFVKDVRHGMSHTFLFCVPRALTWGRLQFPSIVCQKEIWSQVFVLW